MFMARGDVLPCVSVVVQVGNVPDQSPLERETV
jgi:hypothetical protein